MSESLRFCFVTTFYPPYHFGADAVCAYRLAEALAAQGHRVDVAHSVDAYRLQHPSEPEQAYEHHSNVTLHSLRSRRYKVRPLLSHQLGHNTALYNQVRLILENRLRCHPLPHRLAPSTACTSPIATEQQTS